MFLNFSIALFIQRSVLALDKQSLQRFFNRYLNVTTVLYCIAVFDWLFMFATNHSIFPESNDFREHQRFLGIYRFEAFSAVSLGFVSFGVFNFFLSFWLRRYKTAVFYFVLIIAGMAIGGLIAFIVALAFWFFSRLNAKSKALVLVPGLVVIVVMIVGLLFLKMDQSKRWSYNIRVAYWAIYPQVFVKEPMGMGFGHSRFMRKYWDYFHLEKYRDVKSKLDKEKNNVVESSLLELAYEFGVTGIAISLIYSVIVGRLLLRSLRTYNREVAAFSAIILFFYVHCFFEASYFFQFKFWFFLTNY
jgi:hypothetical protein